MGDEDEENDEEEEGRQEKEMFLSRITHLHLEGKGITHIEDVSMCCEVRVIFLQHNHLTRLSNLRPLRLLQELYLQDNHITRLEGLRELHSLRRLLISGNRICVVEGLPQGLQELHIQNQRLPPGDALVLDPQALTNVQVPLRILDISGNRLTEVGAVGLLTNLRILRAVDNELDSLSHVTAVLSRLNSLQEVNFSGNPVTAHRRYHPSMVLASPPTLEILDGKVVTPQSRDFIVQAECHRLSNRKKAKQPGPKVDSVFSMEAHLLFTSVTQTEQTGPPATGPSFVLGALRRPEFDLVLSRAQRQSMSAYLAAKTQGEENNSTAFPETNNQQESNLVDDHLSSDNDHHEKVHGNCIQNSPEGISKEPHSEVAQCSSSSFPFGKSVWFAADEEPSVEEVPRFIPRPYWRNKPPAAKN